MRGPQLFSNVLDTQKGNMARKYPGGYAYIEHIAAADSATVVKAQSPAGGVVALKVSDDQRPVLRRFQREIQATLDAAGPSTMPVLDHDENYQWYAMPLASHSLAELPRSSNPIPEARNILAMVAESLRPLHARGQVHRDLKPENILYLPEPHPGRWVVSDFGIVRNVPGRTSAPLTAEGRLTGTYAWAAPEQHWDAHSVTPAADVYSAGLLMGWMLTGERPIPGVPYKSLGSLASTIARATASDPESRFETLDAFLSHFVDHMLPFGGKLGSLFDDAQYNEVHAYLTERPEQLPAIAKQMLRLNPGQILGWISGDVFGIVQVSIRVCEGLQDYFNEIGRDSVDDFLVWLLSVCDGLVHSAKLSEASSVLASLLAATSNMDQWTPRRAVVEWLDRQLPRMEALAREALEATGTWSYFAVEARQRWSSKRRTALVRDLADS